MYVVNPIGSRPCDVAFVGEAPGETELRMGYPFAGPSGREQENYLNAFGLSQRSFYRSNVVKQYKAGNPTPSEDDIARWGPILVEEIRAVQPKLIVAVGQVASRFFVGNSLDLWTCHGILHKPGELDPSIAYRSNGAIVLPVFHPASGLHEESNRPLIAWDYQQVAKAIHLALDGLPDELASDCYDLGLISDKAYYYDHLSADASELGIGKIIAIDTEGTTEEPWSIQVSTKPGLAYCCRVASPNFTAFISSLQDEINRKDPVVVMHNAMYDLGTCRAMGLDLSSVTIEDTMISSYLMRVEPKSLSGQVWRRFKAHCLEFSDLVGNAAREKQIKYLEAVRDYKFPPPKPFLRMENDGEQKIYSPTSISSKAAGILRKVYEGLDIDISQKWQDIDSRRKKNVDGVLCDKFTRPAGELFGELPRATLGDIPLDEAVSYGCKDADFTLQLHKVHGPVIKSLQVENPYECMCDLLHIFSEMEFNGMLAIRDRFMSLASKYWEEMNSIREIICDEYQFERFNPLSGNDVRKIMEIDGLTALKLTGKGLESTSNKSIGYLRFSNWGIRKVFEWRTLEKLKDGFCAGPIEELGDRERGYIHTTIRMTTTPTRRITCEKPNFLQIPIRTGPEIRNCYTCEEDEYLVASDLAGIEMRVLAHLSQDPALINQFRDGVDTHVETAAKIFQCEPDQVTLEQRQQAKSTAYGIPYGQGPRGLYEELSKLGMLNVSEEECADMISSYLTFYRGVRDYRQWLFSNAESDPLGEIRDLFGMVNYIPGIRSLDKQVQARSQRQIVAIIVSGTAQGMIQNSMRKLYGRIKTANKRLGWNAKWRLQVHDELLFTVKKEYVGDLIKMVEYALTNDHGIEDISVPIEANSSYGKYWGDLK